MSTAQRDLLNVVNFNCLNPAFLLPFLFFLFLLFFFWFLSLLPFLLFRFLAYFLFLSLLIVRTFLLFSSLTSFFVFSCISLFLVSFSFSSYHNYPSPSSMPYFHLFLALIFHLEFLSSFLLLLRSWTLIRRKQIDVLSR